MRLRLSTGNLPNKRSRGTWHAWHFQFALGLVVKVLCGHFCIACPRPLTRR
ncbi:DUF3265 domain-containing protein [Vibrio vulnificus]